MKTGAWTSRDAHAGEYFSVPMTTPDAYTSPGMSDFIIWMNETLRYRYDALENQRLAAYRRPAGSDAAVRVHRQYPSAEW